MRLLAPVRALLSGVRASLVLLGLALLASESIYFALLRFDTVSTTRSVVGFLLMMGGLFAIYGIACLLLTRDKSSRWSLGIVLLGAVLFRLTLLFAGLPTQVTWREATTRVRADIHSDAVTYDSYLLFDNDIWRYIWDGHVGSAGVNPYCYEPRSAQLDWLVDADSNPVLWGDIRANMNHNDVTTIYPPFAQLVFRAAHTIAPGSVFTMKALLAVFDLMTVLLVLLVLRAMERPLTDVVLYAWNPLVIKTVAGSGHMDAVLGACLVLTAYLLIRGCKTLAGIIWAFSVLTKITPVLLLPFLIRRIGWRRTALGIGVICAAYLPYLDSKLSAFVGLFTFGNEWQFNSAFFSLFNRVFAPFHMNAAMMSRALAMIVLIALIGWLVGRERIGPQPFYSIATVVLGSALVLSPTVMPWYIIPILAMATISRSHLWMWFSPLLCLAFVVMIDGTEWPAALALEWAGFVALLWKYRKEAISLTTLRFVEGPAV